MSATHSVVFVLGAEEKTNVELIVPIGSVVIAMFFWLLIVFVIRGRKRVSNFHLRSLPHFSFLGFSLPLTKMPTINKKKRKSIKLEHTHTLWGCMTD